MLSIVIPTYNRNPDLRECLASIRRNSADPNEILVFHPGGDPETEQICSQYGASFIRDGSREAHHRVVSLWAIINRGIDMASSHCVAWLNDDCVVLDGWDRIALSYFRDDVGLVVMKTSGIGPDPSFRIGIGMFGVPVANYGVLDRRTGLRFDEGFNWYHGDADIALQMAATTSYRIAGTSENLVIHKHRVDENRAYNDSDARTKQDDDRYYAKWKYYKASHGRIVRLRFYDYPWFMLAGAVSWAARKARRLIERSRKSDRG